MHPSRYLTLIQGVTAVFLTGAHGIDYQTVALRLVSLRDRPAGHFAVVGADGRGGQRSSRTMT
jgi:hypothetical protein